MTSLHRISLAGFAAVVLACGAWAQALPPVESFGRLPLVSQPKLSPDAKHFAVLQEMQGRPVAVIYETNPTPGSKPAYVGGNTDMIIDSIAWAKNDRLILYVKHSYHATMDKLRTWMRTATVGVNGNDFSMLMRNMPAFQNNTWVADVIDVNQDDPDHILMGLYNQVVHNQGDYNTLMKKKDDIFKYDVVKVDVRTGKGEIYKSGDSKTIRWVSDGHGNPVVQVRRTEPPLQDHVLVFRGSSWSEIGIYDATEDKGSGISSLTEDGTGLVRSIWAASEPYAMLSRYDLSSGKETALFNAPNVDVNDIIEDEWTGRVIGAKYIADRSETVYFDKQRQALQGGVQEAFPGMTVDIVSWDLSKNNVILSVEGPRQPTTYYLLDRKSHQTQLLAASYPELKDSDLGEMKPYQYKARDGLNIPAYLTLPPGKAPKNLPLVVMPHGGPQSRDQLSFDWMAQFLANRGYAVLQPNFRGSSGYGRKFTLEGSGQWGLKMQNDLTDGVKKAIADGIVDPKRVCIAGGSYGGYAALAGATSTPGVYACAISIAGPSDLPLLMGTDIHDAGGGHSKMAEELRLMMGTNLERLAGASPARHAEDADCPILLLHGKNDTTVEIKHSEMMNDALKAAHKPVEFIAFEGEDHQLELAATRVRVLKEMERFLKQHIGS